MGPRSIGALVAAALLLSTDGLMAAPPPPPGGHIPIHFGGSNTAAYPALTPTSVPLPEDASTSGRLEVASAPNPFRQSTVLRFSMTAGEEARIRIFSTSGQEVRDLSHRAIGGSEQEVIWDGRDGRGGRVSSGVYFYRVTIGPRSAIGKLVYLQ
jgi:hypothetical protein